MNITTSAYTVARISSLTSPGVLAAAVISSMPSALCPPSHQYQPAAAASRIAPCASPAASAPRRATAMLSCSTSSVASHSSCSARRRCGPAVSASPVKYARCAWRARSAFARLREPVPGVFLDRVEHPVARCAAALGAQQRFLGQRGQQLEHFPPLGRITAADLLGRVQARPAGEDRESAQDDPFGVGEQLPAPVDHRAQRPVVWQRGTAAAGQQAEPVVKTVGKLIEGHGAQSGRGEFDGQRYPVERPADARHVRQRVGVGGRPDPCAPRRPGPAAAERPGRTRSRRGPRPRRAAPAARPATAPHR